MAKVKTGIKGLDKALKGGIPENNLVLVSGGAGTGKSTLCLQYLIYGALSGEKCLYITTEQTREELLKQAACFDWPIEELEKNKMFHVYYMDILSERNFLETLETIIKKFQPKRIAIDSVTTLTDNIEITDFKDKTAFAMVEVMENVVPTPMSERLLTKNVLYSLVRKLKAYDTTTLLTTELYEDAKGLSADGVSEFICDGVFMLHYLEIGVVEDRSLMIRKMRYTDHSKKQIVYDITNKGIVTKAEE